MKNLFSLLTLVWCSIVVGQNITAVEYFIDADPGVGLATPITGFTPSANVANLNVTVPVNLPAGIHMFGYRSMDSSGKWSLTNFKSVYIVNQEITPIDALEYFWDADAGIGANEIHPIDGNLSNLAGSIQSLNVPLLSLGEHLLMIRTRDTTGRYSLTNFSQPITVTELGIGELEKTGIAVYPNPAQDFLTIAADDGETFRFIIYDINGKKRRDYFISTQQTLDVSDLSSGIYMGYIWKDVQSIQVVKIIKQ